MTPTASCTADGPSCTGPAPGCCISNTPKLSLPRCRRCAASTASTSLPPLLPLRWSTCSISQRAQGPATVNRAAPIRSCAHVSSVKGLNPETTRFGRYRPAPSSWGPVADDANPCLALLLVVLLRLLL